MKSNKLANLTNNNDVTMCVEIVRHMDSSIHKYVKKKCLRLFWLCFSWHWDTYLQSVLCDLLTAAAAARPPKPSWLNYDGSSLHGNPTLQNKTEIWLCCLSLQAPPPTNSPLPAPPQRSLTVKPHCNTVPSFFQLYHSVSFSLSLVRSQSTY